MKLQLQAIAAFASQYWAKSEVDDAEALLQHYEAQQLLHTRTRTLRRAAARHDASAAAVDVDEVEYHEVLSQGLVLAASPRSAAHAGGGFGLPALTSALETTQVRCSALECSCLRLPK